MLLDHSLITERYFFPLDESPPDAFWVDTGEHRLACYRQHRHENAPTVVHFHGNGELVADYVPGFSELLLSMGVNVFFAEYRGYGGSTGVPVLGSMLRDVAAIFDAVGVPEDRIVPYGRSIGSIYALEMARRYPRAAGLIIESGIADVLERILLRATPQELGCTLDELEAEGAKYLDHQAKIGGFEGPQLILHALHDHLVHARHAEALYRWGGGSQKELVLFENGDHNSIFYANQKAYLESLGKFFGRL
jgi:alpha-beta hydrolase superfamily lysophospholipase